MERDLREVIIVIAKTKYPLRLFLSLIFFYETNAVSPPSETNASKDALNNF